MVLAWIGVTSFTIASAAYPQTQQNCDKKKSEIQNQIEEKPETVLMMAAAIIFVYNLL